MELSKIKKSIDSTPAYVFDENIIESNLSQLVYLTNKTGCKVLYSIKALPLDRVLYKAKQYLDGLSVSSLFEARMAKEILGNVGSIHITTPGIRDDEFNELKELCTHISFNSVNQYERSIQNGVPDGSFGLRINPKLSFATDPRFNPCRPFSKLGIELDALSSIPRLIEGLHFHTVFSHLDYVPLEQTIALLKKKFGSELTRLKWLNLGGGYLYGQINHQQPFIRLINELKEEFGFEVFIEPGKAIVGNAGYLVSTVIDSFCVDGKKVLVLDTSVNHNPEVFEYQRKPALLEEEFNSRCACILVGSSCLAGDLFGEYFFEKCPAIGDRMVFTNVGAYSLTKANRFNGYNLPDVYWVDKENKLAFIKHSSYQDYRAQWVK